MILSSKEKVTEKIVESESLPCPRAGPTYPSYLGPT